MLRQTIRASVTRSCGVLPRARVALAQPTRQYHDDLIDHYDVTSTNHFAKEATEQPHLACNPSAEGGSCRRWPARPWYDNVQ